MASNSTPPMVPWPASKTMKPMSLVVAGDADVLADASCPVRNVGG